MQDAVTLDVDVSQITETDGSDSTEEPQRIICNGTDKAWGQAGESTLPIYKVWYFIALK